MAYYPKNGILRLDFATALATYSANAEGGLGWGYAVKISRSHYNDNMKITFDPPKREKALAERGLDFKDAEEVFKGITVEIEDTRKNYGETRIMCYGFLSGRMVVIGYTPRGNYRHVFSMRKANEREQIRITQYIEEQSHHD